MTMDGNNVWDLCVFQWLPAAISVDVMCLEPERYYLLVSNFEFKNVQYRGAQIFQKPRSYVQNSGYSKGGMKLVPYDDLKLYFSNREF